MGTVAPTVIGLSGKSGVGKSAVADRLRRHLLNSRRMSFAYLLKNEVSCLFSFPREWCDMGKNRMIPLTMGMATLGMPRSMTVRELLQWYGTDVIRRRNPEHWVNTMREKIRGTTVDYIIIDDVRFPNEAELIKEHNGLLVRLEPYDGWQPTAGEHASETALDDFTGWDVVFRPAVGRFGADDAVCRAIMAMVRDD